MSGAPEPWERQRGESPQATEAFRLYRDLGPQRSVRKVSEACHKNESLLNRWSQRWAWVERAASWDDEVDRLARLNAVEEVAEMHRRHAQLAVVMLNKVGMRLLGSEDNNVQAIDTNTLSISELARLADVAVKIERLARGEPETVVAGAPAAGAAPDEYRAVSRLMSDDDLVAEAEALAAKLFEDETPARHLRAVGE